MNPEEFDKCGRYVGKPATPAPVEVTEQETAEA
jgi:hypothetical protein